jgi:hypothetical protein
MKKILTLLVVLSCFTGTYAQNIGINTPSPTNTLDVNGTLRVRGGTPGVGKVLTSDANGVGTWTTNSANYPRITYDAIVALPSPTLGDMAYDITYRCLRVYNGSKWVCTFQNPSSKIPNSCAIIAADGTSSQTISDIAVDASGNIYITGSLQGSCNFGGITKSSSSTTDYDIYIAKYSNLGTLAWVTTAGGTGSDSGNGIAVDASNNVFVTGNFSTTATFGATSLVSAGSTDIFLAKFNNAGVLSWVSKSGGTGNDNSWDIDLDSSGNPYIIGDFEGTCSFNANGAATPKTSAGLSDIFWAKFNTGASLLLVNTLGGTGSDTGKDIQLDPSNNIYLAGSFVGTATFGSTSKTSAGLSDVFLVKYVNSGVFSWVSTGGGTGSDVFQSLVCDASGNIYCCGTFENTFNVGATSYEVAKSTDLILVKYNNAGSIIWTQAAGGTNTTVFAQDLDIDSAGNVYVIGYFVGYDVVVNFSSKNLLTTDFSSVFVAKYTPNDQLTWAITPGGLFGWCIALDSSNNPFFGGLYRGETTIGTTNLSPTGTGNLFFVGRLEK